MSVRDARLSRKERSNVKLSTFQHFFLYLRSLCQLDCQRCNSIRITEVKKKKFRAMKNLLYWKVPWH
ncbi:hypothetical protein ACJIZ3_011172 [Penstemon smallii]|uniref:Uncharacterized protein n=1 Tax=Penstemon smallii TaxID=265156 RepID=A0ABD3UIS3_9LAMI